MTYACTMHMSIPVMINGHTVTWCDDVECQFGLDSDGDLVKVVFAIFGTKDTISILSGVVFDVARDHFEKHRDEIMDRAGVPPKNVRRDTPPIYGVGMRGNRYVA